MKAQQRIYADARYKRKYARRCREARGKSAALIKTPICTLLAA